MNVIEMKMLNKIELAEMKIQNIEIELKKATNEYYDAKADYYWYNY